LGPFCFELGFGVFIKVVAMNVIVNWELVLPHLNV